MIKYYLDKNKLFIFVFLLSTFSLLGALFIEHILKVYPCKLCVYQRIPYLLSVFVCFFGYNLNNKLFWFVALIIIFVFSSVISGYHVGIENLIFSEFSGCKNDSLNIQDKNQLLNSLEEINISCKDVVFNIFGLSLATINFIISLTIAALGIIYVIYAKNRQKKT